MEKCTMEMVLKDALVKAKECGKKVMIITDIACGHGINGVSYNYYVTGTTRTEESYSPKENYTDSLVNIVEIEDGVVKVEQVISKYKFGKLQKTIDNLRLIPIEHIVEVVLTRSY